MYWTDSINVKQSCYKNSVPAMFWQHDIALAFLRVTFPVGQNIGTLFYDLSTIIEKHKAKSTEKTLCFLSDFQKTVYDISLSYNRDVRMSGWDWRLSWILKGADSFPIALSLL